MAGTIGVGDLVAWPGGCLLIGKSLRVVPRHAHQAIQLVFGHAGPISLRPDDAGPWADYRLGAIPSRQPHSMDATRASYNAVIFVEPETALGRTLTERLLRGGTVDAWDEAIAGPAAALFDVWMAGAAKKALIEAAQRVATTLARDARPADVTDERILRAIEHIRVHLGARLSLEEVAAQAFLSPSRFRHLFVEQTGMGLRPYLLWRRFILAWEMLSRGETLANAAHGAGFADSAHFTRTSRQMFGFPPSLLRVDAGPVAPES